MKDKIPYHLAVFLDGNRRWAKKRGLSLFRGHLTGYETVKNFCQWCRDRGVKILTLYCFSTENWERPKKEVNYLMNLFGEGLKKEIKDLHKEGVKVNIIGQREKLPQSLQQEIEKAEELTKTNKKYFLNLAVSYGGKWDILQAVQKISERKIPTQKISEDLIEKHLSTAGQPRPDLIIRPGGEKRLSNFLIWQGAYSELYFTDKLWPDFTEKDLDAAFEEYGKRQRRFGT